ncbi:MAG: 50S ribosomal protein L18 [bacterium]|nr:50S ribosomal protein L18 [bacterium]
MLKKFQAIKKRHLRIRQRIRGTKMRPRLAVYKSNRHIYAQIIDDSTQTTLVAASTLSPEFANEKGSSKTIRTAQIVGELIAKKALAKDIREVVFDRGGFRYHGRIKALAEAARAGGLKF